MARLPDAGLAIVDKPPGPTSHDIVNRLRRSLRTRRVGHAGTLDPMATGVLICGFGVATRILRFVADGSKEYTATIRLGFGTGTDDAVGAGLGPPVAVDADDDEIAAALARQTGEIMQRPSQVSAVKVAGRRAYALVRAGEAVDLAPRRVLVSELRVLDVRRLDDGGAHVDIAVTCSTGTYIRAIARDLGESLGCGGHLVALRRTRVGPFELSSAGSVESPVVIGIDEACRSLFQNVELAAADVDAVGHGRDVARPDDVLAVPEPDGSTRPVAVVAPTGEVVGLAAAVGDRLKPVVVFRPGSGT